MRLLERNKRTFYYCLYEGRVPIVDELGHETGEYKICYSEPIKMRGVISPASGKSQIEIFGRNENYDNIIIVDDTDCPIDENSILFIDIPPTYDSDSNPLNDYIVNRIGRSLNSITYAISRVIRA